MLQIHVFSCADPLKSQSDAKHGFAEDQSTSTRVPPSQGKDGSGHALHASNAGASGAGAGDVSDRDTRDGEKQIHVAVMSESHIHTHIHIHIHMSVWKLSLYLSNSFRSLIK